MYNNQSSSKAINEFFFKKGKRLVYKNNQIIIHGDDQPRAFFYIASGYIRIYSILEDGNRIIVGFLGPNGIFPATLNLGKDLSLYRESINECIVYRIDNVYFSQFIKKKPELKDSLLFSIENNVNLLFHRILINGYINPYSRLIACLLVITKHFSKKINNNDYQLNIPLTQQDLGDLINTTRETINRGIQQLKLKNIISSDNKIISVNIEKLKQEMIDSTK